MAQTSLGVNTSGMMGDDTSDCMAEDIGLRLKSARKVRGLSRKVVAARLGVTEAAIQHHESGKNDPSLANIARYSKLYKLSTDWIILGRGKGPQDAREPHEALVEIFDEIPTARQPQALAVLQTFVNPEKQSA